MPEPAAAERVDAPRVLIIDDDDALRETMGHIAAQEGFEVETLGEGAGFIDTVARFRPDRIVMDLSIPDRDGIELLKALAETRCETPIVLVSSHPQSMLNNARDLGSALGLVVCAVLQKPFPAADFLAAIETS